MHTQFLFPENRNGNHCCTKGCKRNRHWATRCKTNPINYYCKHCQDRIKKQTAEQRAAKAAYLRKEAPFAAMHSERVREYVKYCNNSFFSRT